MDRPAGVAPRYRVWTYRTSAVVLGCSQHALFDGVQRRLDGRAALLQRESGGGAVLTGPWLVSASVVLVPDHPWVRGGVVESYRRIAELHVQALAAIGVPARALPPHEVPRADAAGAAAPSWACFGSLSPWELVNADGRKLVGLAQRRRRSAVLLVAGTLVGQADWPLLCHAMGHPEDEAVLGQRTVAGEEVAGASIEPGRFAAVLAQELERELSVVA